MKKRIYSAIGIVLMVAILFVNCFYTNNNGINIADTEVPLSGAEDVFGMLKFENWEQGDYNYQTGKYYSSTTRLCLKECPTVVAGQKFTVNISQNRVHILIREMNDDGKVVVSRDLTNGKIFEISSNTTSIRIAMYVKDSTLKMTYDKYQELFDNGLNAYLTTDSLISNDDSDIVEEDEIKNDVADKIDSIVEDKDSISEADATVSSDSSFGMTDFLNWRTGNYSSSGNYCSSPTRICLNDYVNVVSGQIYVANISDPKFHLLVRELDSNNKFIKSYNLADKNTYTVSDSCVKIGISIYDTKSKTTSFDMYKTLFENGFKATLTLEEGTIEDIIEVEEEIPVYGSSNNQNSSSDVTDVVYPDVKSEIIAMIQNGDTTTHDVSKYHMKWLDVNSIFNSVIENECLLEYECAYGIWISFEKDGDYAKGIKMNGIDDTYADCLAKSKERIANVLAGIDNSMTDLDKALYIYDNIVQNTKYNNNSAKCYYGGNVLAYNTGACTAFSTAYKLLLKEVGIESALVQSPKMNHEWVMIKIDGQWYHTDPTWDNAIYVTKKTASRNYFMRNSSEYQNGKCYRNHFSWTVVGGYTSTSTKYVDWFLHDVTGPITYENGYWLYIDSKTTHAMKAKLDGSDIIDLSM